MWNYIYLSFRTNKNKYEEEKNNLLTIIIMQKQQDDDQSVWTA